MLIKAGVFLVVFAGVFFLMKFFYPFLEGLLTRWQKKRMEKITPKLDKMFLNIPAKKLMMLDVAAPLVSGIAGFIITRSWLFTLIFSAAGLLIPFVIIRRMEAMRKKKFSNQLVDALMLLSSSLKAGMSLQQSLEVVVEEMPTPVSQEFSLAVRQMQMGASLEDAMNALKARMRVDELDMMVTAVMVAKETGGNLPDIFTQVSNTIRERNKLIGRVNALCIQGKLQGWIMSVLPIVFGIVVYKASPHFFDIFLKDKFGRMLLAYAAVSQVLGIFFIRKLSRIDI